MPWRIPWKGGETMEHRIEEGPALAALANPLGLGHIHDHEPFRPNFQDTIKRVYAEWLPSSGWDHAGSAEVEFYPAAGNPQSSDYWCEHWLPLKKPD
jgi:hypothetical protein